MRISASFTLLHSPEIIIRDCEFVDIRKIISRFMLILTLTLEMGNSDQIREIIASVPLPGRQRR